MKLTLLKETDVCLLSLLFQQPLHGYALREYFPDLNTSSLYHRLHKLQQLRLVKATENKVEDAPIRQVYSLTKQGKVFLGKDFRSYLKQKARSAKAKLVEYKELQLSLRQLAGLKAVHLNGSQSHER